MRTARPDGQCAPPQPAEVTYLASASEGGSIVELAPGEERQVLEWSALEAGYTTGVVIACTAPDPDWTLDLDQAARIELVVRAATGQGAEQTYRVDASHGARLELPARHVSVVARRADAPPADRVRVRVSWAPAGQAAPGDAIVRDEATVPASGGTVARSIPQGARALWLWSPDVTDLGAIIIRYRTAPFDDGRAVTIASLPGALALAAYITRGLAVPPGARGLVLENASDDNVPVTIAWGLVP